MSDLILSINCGSSSIKFALFEESGGGQLSRVPVWSGKVEGITGKAPSFAAAKQEAKAIHLDPDQPYSAALGFIGEQIDDWRGATQIRVATHRIVHGGTKYSQPVLVDAEVLADLKRFIPLAPLHQPFAVEAVEQLLAERPDLLQVACFDTAFHHSMPDVEKMLPLNWRAWERGVRRYGFHGLSYEYQSIVLAEKYAEAARGLTVVAHLGSGASLCAMRQLRSVATTMGFSALDGIMMGTRAGALDPGVLLYMMEIEKLSLEEMGQLLYHGSGLLGISGVSSDPRVLLAREASDPYCAAALSLYVNSIVREIGSLVAGLGGLDMLVFTAGIGEHNPVLRERICRRLSFLDVVVDPVANAASAPVISADGSRIVVVVEPTNEEWVAASSADRLMRRS